MEVYVKEIHNDGLIIMRKEIINTEKFNISRNNDGDIILNKKICIEIKTMSKLKEYDYTNSEIIYCKINDFDKLEKPCSYNKCLIKVYEIIGDGTKIIKNSSINIKTTIESDKGFKYLEKIGISYQGIDANKCIREIISQCTKNKISIRMKIKLSDDTIIKLDF